MVDPDELVRLSRRLEQLYADVEVSLLRYIAKRLARGLGDDDWAVKRLGDVGVVRSRARRIVSSLQRERDKEIVRMVVAAHAAGAESAARTTGIAATIATVDSEAASRALVHALSGNLSQADLRILRSADDIYRRVIANVTARGLADEFTRRAAAQAALDMFAEMGITGFTDMAGRNWSLTSYAEMAARTSIHNAARQGVIDGVRATGRDLVMISGSPACCDLCAPWEGQVVSLDGMTTGYPTLSDAEADGVFHPGCRHTVAPYVEGLTRADYYQQGDPERYAAEQQQRYLERGLRQWKRREALALDPTQAQLAQNKIGEWRRRLEEHVTKHDLPREREREQISKAI